MVAEGDTDRGGVDADEASLHSEDELAKKVLVGAHA